MSFTCNRCGEQWARHPVTRVPCPACHVAAGQWCVRPSGHAAAELHVTREQLALDTGAIRPCPATPSPDQPDLFDAAPTDNKNKETSQ